MKYRVTLTIHETGSMSKEDFRKLQEAVDTIAKVTDLTIAIEGNPANIATTIWHSGDQPMETGKHNPDFERWPHNVTIKDIYGQE